MFQSVEISTDLNGLEPLLERLDWLIKQAISTLQTRKKAEEELQISWLQKIEISSEAITIQIRSDSPLAWLQNTFSLSSFDLDILVIALAPELDRQYEKIYAYLQDNMSSKRPTVDLVLNLLCSNIQNKLSRRKHFSNNSPLIYHHLLHLSSELTLLSAHLFLDSQVIRFLLHQPGLDSRLTICCQLLETTLFADTLSIEEDVQKKLQTLVKEDWQKQQPLLLYFQGNDGTGKRHTAQIIAKNLEVSLLVADFKKIVEDKAHFQDNVKLLWREAWFFNHLLYLDNFDILYLQENSILYQIFITELEKHRGITILAGVQNWIPTATGVKGVITVPFTIPESKKRRECWQKHLKTAQISIKDKDLDVLSNRFRLTPNQIADAVATAYNTARWQAISTKFSANEALENNSYLPKEIKLEFVDLCNAARAQSGHDLANLAQKITPKYTWDDIVL
ncbi:MAG: ATP-binding protein, partial [Moorea sp. SIO2B7]|nr:ATP-binding protein [Moorena sp. SIO2B7]